MRRLRIHFYGMILGKANAAACNLEAFYPNVFPIILVLHGVKSDSQASLLIAFAQKKFQYLT